MRSPAVVLTCLGLCAVLWACPQAATVDPAFSCASSTDCAAGWACVDGACRRRCAVDVDCGDPARVCVNAVCVDRATTSSSGAAASSSSSSSSAGGVSSSGDTSSAFSAAASGSSADASSTGTSSASGLASSAASTSTTSSSNASSASGPTGPRYTAPLVEVMGGGGMVLWDQGRLQLGVGQPVAGPPVTGPSTTLWPGLHPTVRFP